MEKRAPGFGKPKWKRAAEPREIEHSAAAPEPPGGSSEPVFRDHVNADGDLTHDRCRCPGILSV